MEITRTDMENIIAHIKRGGEHADAEVMSAFVPAHPGYRVDKCFVRTSLFTSSGPVAVEVYIPNSLRRVTCANTESDIAAAVAYLAAQVV